MNSQGPEAASRLGTPNAALARGRTIWGTACLVLALALVGTEVSFARFEKQDDSGTEYRTSVVKSSQPAIAPSKYQLWIPDQTKRIRVLIVINRRGAGKYLYESDGRWREMVRRNQAAMLYCDFEAQGVRKNGFGASILKACEQFAKTLNRPELEFAPMVVWGHSMGGRVAQDFARYCPQRVLAFHIGLRANPSNPDFMEEEKEARKIPALYLMGEKDSTPDDIKKHFLDARAKDSPRAWIRLPGQSHWPKGMIGRQASFTQQSWDLWMGNDVLIPWTEAVIRLRLPAEDLTHPDHAKASAGTDPENSRVNQRHEISLRPLKVNAGWLGKLETGKFYPYPKYPDDKGQAAWFPDQATAQAWARYSFPSPESGREPE